MPRNWGRRPVTEMRKHTHALAAVLSLSICTVACARVSTYEKTRFFLFLCVGNVGGGGVEISDESLGRYRQYYFGGADTSRADESASAATPE